MWVFAVDLLAVQERGAAGNAGSASLATVVNLVKARADDDDDDDGSIFWVSSPHKTVLQERIKKLNGHFLHFRESSALPHRCHHPQLCSKRKVYPFNALV